MNYSPRCRVWLDIDLQALSENFDAIAAHVAPAGVIAVLKADAYGMGAHAFAAALCRRGVAGFGVAEPAEALPLLPFGLPVQILSSVLPEEIEDAAAAGIRLPVTDLATARLIDAAGAKIGRRVKVHLKIDTGMGRLGILLKDAREIVPQVAVLPNLEIEGIFSHFPNAYAADDEGTRRQVAGLASLVEDLEARGIRIPKRHIANSDGINNVTAARLPPFNFVRTGINLHGLFDEEGAHAVAVRPVAALRTRLVSIRRLPAGTSIGYGRTCRLERDTTVGVVAAGYADGMPLALSNHGRILLRGKACPVLGRISMDYTTISLEGVPEAVPGDIATCIGRDGSLEITANEWARLKRTHPYEVICGFGNRVERRYSPPRA